MPRGGGTFQGQRVQRDPLGKPGRLVGFEVFRLTLAGALASGDGAKGGRPPYVIVQGTDPGGTEQHQRRVYRISVRDRLSWLRAGNATPGLRRMRSRQAGPPARSI